MERGRGGLTDKALQIAVYGMSKFDSSDSRLVSYEDCNDLSSIPNWVEHTQVSGTAMPSIADNRYVGWVYEFGESKAEVGVPPDNPVLPQLVDTSDVRHQTVKVIVDSAYRLGIAPSVGVRRSARSLGGNTIDFRAPEFIYLDRFRNEIGTSDQPNPAEFLDRAYYRARNLGYAVQRGADSGSLGTVRFLSRPLSEPITVTWRWTLECAVFIESNTSELEGIDAGSLGSPTIDGISTSLGLHWMPIGTHLRTGIDAIIGDSSGPAGLPARYETRGFTVENASDSDDRFLYFDGIDSRLHAEVEIPVPSDFSIDFWARRDARDTDAAESLVSLNVLELENYDTSIADDAAAGLTPVAKLTSPLDFDGTNTESFDFGALSGSATFEFIVRGDPAVVEAILASNAGGTSSLSFVEKNSSGALGFSEGGSSHEFSPDVAAPTDPQHIAFRWDATPKTMEVYINGEQKGSVTGVDFQMPSGSNGKLGLGLEGTIFRLTTYNSAIAPARIAAHAQGWLACLSGPTIRAGFRASDDADNPDGQFIQIDSDQSRQVFDVPGSLVDDQWHHWAWTYDATAGAVLCYRDGVAVQTFDGSEIGNIPQLDSVTSATNRCSPGRFPTPTPSPAGSTMCASGRRASTPRRWHSPRTPHSTVPPPRGSPSSSASTTRATGGSLRTRATDTSASSGASTTGATTG